MGNVLTYSLPIIQKFEAYSDYPFEAIDPSAMALLKQANAQLPREYRKQFQILVRAFECFLQVTGQRISRKAFIRPEFSDTYRAFVGALNSTQFVDRTVIWRYSMTRALNALLTNLQESLSAPKIQIVRASSIGPTEEIESCTAEFRRLPLHDEKVWLWHGWVAQSRSGGLMLLPLYPVYVRLGREFTEKLFQVCKTFTAKRRQLTIRCLRPLAQFIGSYEKPLQADDFKNSQFTTTFWRDFYVFHMVTGYANGDGACVSTLAGEWNGGVAVFVAEGLEPSGLFAEPWGQFPRAESREVPGARTNIKTTAEGHEVKTKLLTDIPLHVTDEQALELLFHQIEADVKVFVDWAESATKDIWTRYERRQNQAAQGTSREIQRTGVWHSSGVPIWLTDRNNPNHLSNAAATFRHHGFLTSDDIGIAHLYPLPLSQTAYELALPVTDALFPHCVLLVADHPIITPSFLENFKLFDRNGKQTGFVKTDSGAVLIGYKYRSGAKHAEQKVLLTKRGTELVEQIIALTQPLREYLKQKHSDEWRSLLLTCKQGFAFPASIKGLYQTSTIPIRVELFAERLGNTCLLSFDKRRELVKRFSLPSLRASVAVLEYLRTSSGERMAKALGHAKYDHRLLSCYLPEPILNFFQERWVRIFQAGIIVETMKDSELLLQATEFRIMAELDEFLRNHALRVLPPRIQNEEDACCEDMTPNKEVVFGVSVGILTALISLQLAVGESVARVSAKARYWAGIAARLVAYIETDLSNRADLQGLMATARRNANPSFMEHLLYE